MYFTKNFQKITQQQRKLQCFIHSKLLYHAYEVLRSFIFAFFMKVSQTDKFIFTPFHSIHFGVLIIWQSVIKSQYIRANNNMSDNMQQKQIKNIFKSAGDTCF